MNFRYEDPNAATISTHARNALAEESMRRKDSTRKEARERKINRVQEEKDRRKEELLMLKAMKREEIFEKIKQCEEIAGQISGQGDDFVKRVQKELETEFIPDLYDKTMSKNFGDGYYETVKKEDILEEADEVEDQNETAKLLKGAKNIG